MIHRNSRLITSGLSNNLCRYSSDSLASRNFIKDYGSSSNSTTVSNSNITQDFGTGAYQNPVSNFWVPGPLLLFQFHLKLQNAASIRCPPPQKFPPITIECAMIYHNALSNSRSWMDIYTKNFRDPHLKE